MLQQISLWLRNRRKQRKEASTLQLFNEYAAEIAALPAADTVAGKQLLIRLDDIGDYVLFRNTLEVYKEAAQKKGGRLYLLGNEAWKPLYKYYDSATAEQVIWLNKGKYLHDAGYRRQIWLRLREEGFETAIAPARTRPLILDDICVLASAAPLRIAAANNHTNKSWNSISDKLYSSLMPTDKLVHELVYNAHFTFFATQNPPQRIHFHLPFKKEKEFDYIICFIGASAQSKRWPASHWNRFIREIEQQYAGKIYVAGGPADKELAAAAAQNTSAVNIAGSLSLVEMVNLIGNANLVISNDTMAAHIGVATEAPTLIISNGTNGHRFTRYRPTLQGRPVETLFSPRYQRLLDKNNLKACISYSGTTSDIKAITVSRVLGTALQMIQ